MKIGFISFVIFASSLVAVGQDVGPEVGLIRTFVTDEYGRLVSGLRPEHVTIKRGKETIPVLRVTSEKDEPVAIAIVIDGSYQPAISAKVALQFIQKANTRNDYCIIRLDEGAEVLAPWRGRDEDIISALRTIAATEVKTAKRNTFDAIILGLENLRRSQLNKKALLIFGTSNDTNSRTNFGDLKNAILDADAIVYGVSFELGADPFYQVDSRFEKIAELGGGRHLGFYLRSRRLVPARDLTSVLSGNVPRQPPVDPLNVEEDISEFSEMLVQNVQITHLLAFEDSSSKTKRDHFEVRVNLHDPSGKKMALRTHGKRL